MKSKSVKYVLLFIGLSLSCSTFVTSQKNETAANINLQEAKITEKPDAELQKQIVRIADAAKGKVGISAVNFETGESVSLNLNGHFPMQSVYKLPIAMAVLKRTDDGNLKLEQKINVGKSDFVRQGQHSPIRDKNPNGAELTVEELLKFAVSESDGTASDVLFNLIGGSGAMSKYLAEIEVAGMIAANTEKEIGQDWETQYRNYSSPDAAVKLLRALYEKRGISDQSQKFLLKIMVESIPGQKRLKGLLPADAIVAHKTGTSGTQDGITAATNDIGIINLPNGNHLAIAVFVSDSPVDEKTREETIAKIAKAVWDKWSGSSGR